MIKIDYSNNVYMGIDGEYYDMKVQCGWVDRYCGLNHNYSITTIKGNPYTFYIYLALHNYRADDILVYKGQEKYKKDLNNTIKQIIPIIDKNLMLEKQIHEWKKEHISYYFDKDFNIIGHGYNNLLINEPIEEQRRRYFLYNYYNEKPLKDVDKLKYEYYPKNEYLYTYDIGSWGYCSTGTCDNELKQICKEKIIQESRKIS